MPNLSWPAELFYDAFFGLGSLLCIFSYGSWFRIEWESKNFMTDGLQKTLYWIMLILNWTLATYLICWSVFRSHAKCAILMLTGPSFPLSYSDCTVLISLSNWTFQNHIWIWSDFAYYFYYFSKAAVYFNKIQCFCFEEQRLLPGEQIDMPVSYDICVVCLRNRISLLSAFYFCRCSFTLIPSLKRIPEWMVLITWFCPIHSSRFLKNKRQFFIFYFIFWTA